MLKASGLNVTDPHILTLENVQLSDSGRYICIVDNTQGRNTREAWIEVVSVESKGMSTSYYSLYLLQLLLKTSARLLLCLYYVCS